MYDFLYRMSGITELSVPGKQWLDFFSIALPFFLIVMLVLFIAKLLKIL